MNTGPSRHYKPGHHVAVWKYDLYPYYLCGVIEDYVANGRVKVKGYGGYIFKPIKTIWGKEAEEFLKAFEELRDTHSEAKRVFDAIWKEAAEKLLEGDK
jgi:hypothetical protein